MHYSQTIHFWGEKKIDLSEQGDRGVHYTINQNGM